MSTNGSKEIIRDPRSIKQAAFRKLQQLQQKGAASKYALAFKATASPLQWDDEPLIFHFYEGLKEQVKDDICVKEWPETLDEFAAMAIKIDNYQYARRSEKRAARRRSYD